MEFKELVENINKVLPKGQPVYLVGGAVRDMLLGRAVNDLDFVLAGDTRPIARQVANALGSGYFVLDDERHMARVVYEPGEKGEHYMLDFVEMVEGDLKTDLGKRDFTVNAMAVDVTRLDILVDPFHGLEDLKSKVLRSCLASSMEDDPLRVMRGLRIANSFGLRILPDTLALMRKASPGLVRISPERRRDELFKILAGPRPAVSIQAMQHLGMMPFILPELERLKDVGQSPPHIDDVWLHTLGVMKSLEKLLNLIENAHRVDPIDNLIMSMAILHLGRFKQKIISHMDAPLNLDRSLPSLLQLAALYHDVAKPLTARQDEHGRIRNFNHEVIGADIGFDRAKDLRLSTEEAKRLEIIIRHHMRIHFLAQSGEPLSRRAIFRFFQDVGEAGIDIGLLSLADTLATYGHTLPVEVWETELKVCCRLFESWWDKPEESVRPPVLLDGHDITRIFNLKPGPRIGRVLSELKEAQAIGQINSKDEAQEFIRKALEHAMEED
jgi:poly(A) polymerase